MTAIIVVNSIAMAIVVLGLAAVTRLGHLMAGGRFGRTPRRLDLHRGQAEQQEQRRAA